MTAQSIIETKEIQWLIAKSKPQADFDGSEIPGSALFTGNLPPRMARTIKKMFKNAGAIEQSAAKSTGFSIASGDTEQDFSVSVRFGAYKSTQNKVKFMVSPFTW